MPWGSVNLFRQICLGEGKLQTQTPSPVYKYKNSLPEPLKQYQAACATGTSYYIYMRHRALHKSETIDNSVFVHAINVSRTRYFTTICKP